MSVAEKYVRESIVYAAASTTIPHVVVLRAAVKLVLESTGSFRWLNGKCGAKRLNDLSLCAAGMRVLWCGQRKRGRADERWSVTDTPTEHDVCTRVQTLCVLVPSQELPRLRCQVACYNKFKSSEQYAVFCVLSFLRRPHAAISCLFSHRFVRFLRRNTPSWRGTKLEECTSTECRIFVSLGNVPKTSRP